MMSVGRRLALSLVPAIVGLVAAVGLAYYGEYQRQAPEWFVAVALVSGLGSLVVAWIVTRQVARRIARLADWHNTRESAIQRAARALHDDGIIVAPPASNADELDTMEAIVDRLTSAYATLRRQHREIAARSDAQRATWDRLANEAADAVVARLEDVRLPLHILLENHFGELNENQEEMLGAARHAAELADQVALGLRDLARLDLGVLELRSDLVRFSDLMATILPGIAAEAEARGVAVDSTIAPAIPTFIGDRERLQEALTLLLRNAVSRTPPGTSLTVRVEHAPGDLRLTITGTRLDPDTLDGALAERIIVAAGGRLMHTEDGVVVHLRVRHAGPPL
jgi:signal transduction histidine kinase